MSLVPKLISERITCLFAICIMPGMGLLQLLHVLPHYRSSSDPIFYVHTTAAALLLFETMGNFVQLLRKSSTIRGLILSSSSSSNSSDWRYCAECECSCPPRSQHCFTCGTCVLKRDHHCLFSGNCVGLHNQRHFLLTAAYCAVAATYCSLYNFWFVVEAHDGLSWRCAFQMLLPFVSFLCGVSSLYQACIGITQAVCCIGACLMWFLTIFHTNLLLRNQTSRERAHLIADYDVGRWSNIGQVFGHRPLLSCLLPFLHSPPTVDGVSFPLRSPAQSVRKYR